MSGGVARPVPAPDGTEFLNAGSDRTLRKRLGPRLGRKDGVRMGHGAEDRASLVEGRRQLDRPVVRLDPPISGFEGVQRLPAFRTASATTRTTPLVESPDEEGAVVGPNEGALGHRSRGAGPERRLPSIRLVERGESWMSRQAVTRPREDLTPRRNRPRRPGRRFGLLTRREFEIMGLVASGASNKEIADRLSVAEKTVKAHLTHIFHKLGVANRLQVASRLMRGRGARPRGQVPEYRRAELGARERTPVQRGGASD